MVINTAKYCLNPGGVAVDIGQHDNDIFWCQRRVLFEHGQQLVVEHFHFPQGAVAAVKLQ